MPGPIAVTRRCWDDRWDGTGKDGEDGPGWDGKAKDGGFHGIK